MNDDSQKSPDFTLAGLRMLAGTAISSITNMLDRHPATVSESTRKEIDDLIADALKHIDLLEGASDPVTGAIRLRDEGDMENIMALYSASRQLRMHLDRIASRYRRENYVVSVRNVYRRKRGD